jgi:hypothetical protein
VKRDPMQHWLTPQEVGNMAGVSAKFIRDEIRGGELTATLLMSRRGKLGRYRIKPEDAKVYIGRLQIELVAPSQPSGNSL